MAPSGGPLSLTAGSSHTRYITNSPPRSGTPPPPYDDDDDENGDPPYVLAENDEYAEEFDEAWSNDADYEGDDLDELEGLSGQASVDNIDAHRGGHGRSSISIGEHQTCSDTPAGSLGPPAVIDVTELSHRLVAVDLACADASSDSGDAISELDISSSTLSTPRVIKSSAHTPQYIEEVWSFPERRVRRDSILRVREPRPGTTDHVDTAHLDLQTAFFTHLNGRPSGSGPGDEPYSGSDADGGYTAEDAESFQKGG
jgi:hypothetical protein